MDAIEIVGSAIYWCEGTKHRRRERNGKVFDRSSDVEVVNTDLQIIKLFLKYLRHLGCDERKLRARLCLFGEMDENAEKEFWSKETGIPPNQFGKSTHRLRKGFRTRKLEHAIMTVRYYDVKIRRRIDSMIGALTLI